MDKFSYTFYNLHNIINVIITFYNIKYIYIKQVHSIKHKKSHKIIYKTIKQYKTRNKLHNIVDKIIITQNEL